jgi:hypothetical protein
MSERGNAEQGRVGAVVYKTRQGVGLGGRQDSCRAPADCAMQRVEG